MSFNAGENIGPYRIIEQLGQGGMATVYKAYHASLDRYVAIKVLHPAFNEDNTFEARFQREARVVARLEHPNIVPVYDYAEHEKRPYLVMKYIEGDTLKAYMSKGPLSSEDIRKIVDAVGASLSYAHTQGILHRDIKPSNVLVATDGQMYLADFGLARIAQSGESTLSSDMIMGTPQYISPEQAMGKKDLDAGTDIYSFGVMLYEMVVGHVPFSADTPFSIIHDHIYSPLPLPHVVNPNVPEPVERVLLKALAKDRADRYEDVATMVEAFKDAWEEAGVPMQGTLVRLASAKKEKTGSQGSKATQAAQPEPTKMAVKSEPTKMAAKAEVAIPAPEAKKKRSASAWVWVSAGLVVVLCIVFLVFARNTRLFGRLIAASNPPTVVPTVEQITPAPVPLSFKATASSFLEGRSPSNAIDGDIDSLWNSGQDPEQWIQVDLGKLVTVKEIRLVVSQDPAGPTVHQVWGGADENNLVFFHEFAGETKQTDVLVFTPTKPIDPVRYIKVLTLKSPSWVAWREIEIDFSPPGQAEALPIPTLAANEPELPPEVMEAQKRANDNPNDFDLQLDLALAFWNAEKFAGAYETLGKIIKLAGPDNEPFYTRAGDKFMGQKEGWLPAATMYFQAVKTYGLNGNVPEQLQNTFHESYYKGADRPETPAILSFEKVGQVDQPIALIAQSRNAFYTGHLDEAHTLLNQVKRLKPNMYEALLLEAEYNSAEGEPAKARLLVRSLTSDLSVPLWIRIYAEEIQKRLN